MRGHLQQRGRGTWRLKVFLGSWLRRYPTTVRPAVQFAASWIRRHAARRTLAQVAAS